LAYGTEQFEGLWRVLHEWSGSNSERAVLATHSGDQPMDSGVDEQPELTRESGLLLASTLVCRRLVLSLVADYCDIVDSQDANTSAVHLGEVLG
jgi:hypothetical protein